MLDKAILEIVRNAPDDKRPQADTAAAASPNAIVQVDIYSDSVLFEIR